MGSRLVDRLVEGSRAALASAGIPGLGRSGGGKPPSFEELERQLEDFYRPTPDGTHGMFVEPRRVLYEQAAAHLAGGQIAPEEFADHVLGLYAERGIGTKKEV